MIKTVVLFAVFWIGLAVPLMAQNEDLTNSARKIAEAWQNAATEEEFSEWAKANANRVSHEVIVAIAAQGADKRHEAEIAVAHILAETKGVDSTSAAVYYHTGEYYYYLSRNAEATLMFEKSLRIYQTLNNSEGSANSYQGLGDVLLITGNPSAADSLYRIALGLYEQTGDLLGQGAIYRNLGDRKSKRGEDAEAEILYRKALALGEQTGDRVCMGNAYQSLGDLRASNGQDEEAERFYKKAQAYYELAEKPLSLGNVLCSLGDLAYRIGENEKAETLYKKAFGCFREAEDPRGQADAYLDLAELYRSTGKNEQAEMFYREALPLYKQADDPTGQGSVYQGLGESLIQTGRDDKAEEYFRRALTFFESADNAFGTANILWNLGDIAMHADRYAEADSLYRLALGLFQQTGSVLGQANLYRALAVVQYMRSNYAAADSLYRLALPFFWQVDEPIGLGNVYKGFSDLAMIRKDYPTALAYIDSTYECYVRADQPKNQSIALLRKGKILERLGNVVEAAPLYAEALGRLEYVRENVGRSEEKGGFLQDMLWAFEEACSFLLRNNFRDAAFIAAEKMKARVFLDQLAERAANVEKGIDPELRVVRDSLAAIRSALTVRIEHARKQKMEGQRDSLLAIRNRVDREFEWLVKEIRFRNAAYAGVQYPEGVDLRQLQSTVLQPDEVLIEYLVTDSAVYAFIVQAEAFDVVRINAGKAALAYAIDEFLRGCRNPGSVSTKDELYTLVFQPLESYLKGRTSLIIVLDMDLALCPFEGLALGPKPKTGAPEYLAERYSISYTQSASVLAQIRSRPRQPKSGPSLAAFGDPVYDYANYVIGKPEKGAARREEADILNRLEGSGQEVRAIRKLFPGKRAVVYLRGLATEENAKSPALEKYTHILFSCHGTLAEGYQGLIFSQGLPGAKEDGYLTMEELMNCAYDAELIALSACQTGKGKMERGEGVTGLMRSVLYAGSRSVVASLWNVSDAGTKELMTRFFAKMIKGKKDKKTALREAKLQLLRSGRYTHPYYWSAFVMYGE